MWMLGFWWLLDNSTFIVDLDLFRIGFFQPFCQQRTGSSQDAFRLIRKFYLNRLHTIIKIHLKSSFLLYISYLRCSTSFYIKNCLYEMIGHFRVMYFTLLYIYRVVIVYRCYNVSRYKWEDEWEIRPGRTACKLCKKASAVFIVSVGWNRMICKIYQQRIHHVIVA